MADHGKCMLQQVDLWAGSNPAALKTALGFAPPEAMGHVVERNGIRVARISTRRYWIIGEQSLIRLHPEVGAVLPLDQGRISMMLSGAGARSVLSQLMAIDWHDARTKPGRLVLGAIHRVPVAVLPHAADRYELLMPRSFADSLSGLIAEIDPA